MLSKNWALPEKADATQPSSHGGWNAHQAETYGYRERDEDLRQHFIDQLAHIKTEHLVYVDEAGFDNRDDYPYGYSPKGERCYAFKSGKKRERTSWIAALKQGQVFAPLTFEGSCNRHVVKAWLSDSLLPQLKHGDIIVLDNATFYKGESIRELVAKAGCELWYLPPYSPDLNKRCDPASAKDARERAPRQSNVGGAECTAAFQLECIQAGSAVCVEDLDETKTQGL